MRLHCLCERALRTKLSQGFSPAGRLPQRHTTMTPMDNAVGPAEPRRGAKHVIFESLVPVM